MRAVFGWCVVLVGLLVAVQPAHAGRRVALVVGNASYAHTTSLPGATVDAASVATALQELGFEVTLAHDTDRRGFVGRLAAFEDAAEGADVAFFYYAGHAIQVDGHNFLVPVDAELEDAKYADVEAVDARRILKTMHRASTALNVVVLDACRDNPFVRQWRSDDRSVTSRGLEPMAAPAGSFVLAFSTAPGDTAADSSPYAAELVANLKRPCADLARVFGRVSTAVTTATRGQQRPWTNFTGDAAFDFVPAGCPATTAGATSIPAPVDPVASATTQARPTSPQANPAQATTSLPTAGPIARADYPRRVVHRPLTLPRGMASGTLFAGITGVNTVAGPSAELVAAYGVSDTVEIGAGAFLWSPGTPTGYASVHAHVQVADTKRLDWSPGASLTLGLLDYGGSTLLLDATTRLVVSDSVYLFAGHGLLSFGLFDTATASVSANVGIGGQLSDAVLVTVDGSVATVSVLPDVVVEGPWNAPRVTASIQGSPSARVDVGLAAGGAFNSGTESTSVWLANAYATVRI